MMIQFVLGNLLQSLQALGLGAIFYFSSNLFLSFLLTVAWIYLVPPLLAQLLYFWGGRPEGKITRHEKAFWIWYFGAQLQSIYLRFSFLEEILRLFPLVYSAWLRLWGAKIGRGIYWAPQSFIIDRTHLRVDDFAMIGFGVAITAHHLNRIQGLKEMELILASPHVGAHAILGGLCGLGPGTVVAAGEMLPSTMVLAPFYAWKGGRRHSTLPRG